MTIKLPERSEFGSGAIRVASPLCATDEGRSIMATDLESLGECGACVRMIIYWECSAAPILTYTAIYRSFRQRTVVACCNSVEFCGMLDEFDVKIVDE